MVTTAVIGATGVTGRRIVAALRELEITNIVAIGRNLAVLEELSASHPGITTVQVDVDNEHALVEALAGVNTAISAVGPFAQFGRTVVEAALATHTDLIDVSGEQDYTRWVFEQADRRARHAGCRLVPSAGFEFFVGDVLAGAVGESCGALSEVHLSYSFMTPAGRGATASAGTRRSIAWAVQQPFVVLRNGELVEERLAHTRRLAWFPRPIGPRHAATIGGTEALSVPRHQPWVRTVTTSLAMSGWKAELAQLVTNSTAYPWGRSLVDRWGNRPHREPAPERLASTRWAVVAEGIGSQAKARAWANGLAPYETTASIVAILARHLSAGGPQPGARAPAEVAPATQLLDQLADRGILRWGRTVHG